MKIKMSMQDYHAKLAVGSSGVRTVIEHSPAHYLYNKTHPSDPTPAQRFGSITHDAMLEPKLFRANSIIEPEFAGKGSRQEKEDWHLANHGKLILPPKQKDMVDGILDSISSHPLAASYLAAGAAEESYFWTDPDTGVECKCRPDFLKDSHIVVDVKTTEDANYQPFKKDIGGYLYHVQAAFYLDGVTHITGKRHDEFVIVAVEKHAPFVCNVFLLEESAINEGRALYKQALSILAKCIKTGVFPAYPQVLNNIDLPTWAYRSER